MTAVELGSLSGCVRLIYSRDLLDNNESVAMFNIC